MGAGAGVIVKCSDFTGCTYRNGNLHINMDWSSMESYMWGLKCRGSGSIIIPIGNEVKSLRPDDISWANTHAKIKKLIKMDVTYSISTWENENDLHFTIGGGYCHTNLQRGMSYDVDDGRGLGIDINLKGIDAEGRTVDCGTTIYPERMQFLPSDRFVDMYQYCWDNWYQEDFDIFDVESMFNDDDFYNSRNIKLPFKKKMPVKKRPMLKASKAVKPKTAVRKPASKKSKSKSAPAKEKMIG